jgi:hypothetical protein
MDAQALGIAENGADHQNALQVQRHEIAFALGLALLHPGVINLGIGGIGGCLTQRAQACDIGNGFNVKYKDRPAHDPHFSSRVTA